MDRAASIPYPTDRQTPCGRSCDSCGKAESCEAMTPLLARPAPLAAAGHQPSEGATWK